MKRARLGLALVLALFLALPAWAASQRAEVVYINDGDTITVRLEGKEQLVRLIGVDAPETGFSKALARRARRRGRTPEQEAAAGRAARQAAREMVKVGDVVRLVDGRPQSPKRGHYGRLLAFVYLPDGRMLNQELIAGGWARAYGKFSYRHKADFLRAEKQARQQRRGLWAQGGP